MKKILAMLLCLCMMASLFAATALAEEPEEAAGEYRLGLGVVLKTDSSKAGNAQVDATTAAVVLDAEGKIVAVKIDVAQSKMDVTDGQVDTEKEFLTKVPHQGRAGRRLQHGQVFRRHHGVVRAGRQL